MKLIKLEKETIINFTEAEETASIYTHNSRIKRRLSELTEKRPDECYKTPGKFYDGVTFEIPISWIRINPPRELSEVQKKLQIHNLEKQDVKIHYKQNKHSSEY